MYTFNQRMTNYSEAASANSCSILVVNSLSPCFENLQIAVNSVWSLRIPDSPAELVLFYQHVNVLLLGCWVF